MRIAAHVFRRGAVYTWRRRIPKTCGTKRNNRYIQVSLKTRDPALARRLGAILHGESAHVFEDMASSRLTPEQAKLWLEHVVDAELERIRIMRLDAMNSSDPDRQADDRLADELAAHAYRLVAQRGRSAQFDPETDQGLADRGFSEDELRRGRAQIDLLKRDFWDNSQHAKIRNAAGTVLGLETMPAVLYEDLRKLKLEGRGAAYAASLTDNPDTPFNELVAAVSAELLRRRSEANDFFEVAGRTRLPGNADSTHVSDLEPGTPEPADAASPKIARPNDTDASPEKRTANPHSPSLAATTERLVTKLQKTKVKQKTIDQARQIMALFEEITEVSDVRQLEQHHLGTFVETLEKLPKSYRKSPKDKDKPISYFRELGKSLPPEKVGLVSRRKVGDLADEYLRKRARELQPGGYKSIRYSVGLFVSVHGPKPACLLSSADGKRFMGQVARLAPTIGKSHRSRKLGMDQLLRFSEGQGSVISVRTQKRIVSQVSCFLRWAVKEGHIAANPFASVGIEQRVRPAPYAVLTNEEVRLLLGV